MLKISSPAFVSGGKIPAHYTCDGANVNPPLKIENVPIDTRSLIITVVDPDSASGNFTHWVAWNIDGGLSEIAEGQVPLGARYGVNDFGNIGYGGPCPGRGEHRYYFRVYALDTIVDMPNGSSRAEIESLIGDNILDKGELIGRYERSR